MFFPKSFKSKPLTTMLSLLFLLQNLVLGYLDFLSLLPSLEVSLSLELVFASENNVFFALANII